MVRFIHAADIHLDSPMSKLNLYEGAPLDEIRGASRRAFSNLIDAAIDHDVDFVVIAGDLYDGNWRDHNTGLFFCHQVQRLRKAEIPLYFIAGNHDAENKMTNALPLPANPDGSAMQLSSQEVESIELHDLGVVLHGRGFRNQAETDNLALGYPTARTEMLNIGMLHTSLQGASGHATYAPCTPQQLTDKGYDYWALGHIHQRADRSIDPSCPVVFPGNIQGRHVGECGPKGCMLVELGQRGPAKLEFIPLDVSRWHVCTIDATNLSRPDDMLAAFGDKLSESLTANPEHTLIVRVVLSGQCSFHAELISRHEHWQSTLRQMTFEYHQGRIWMEQLKITTNPLVASDIEIDDDSLGEMAQILKFVASDDTFQELVRQSLRPLAEKLPPEIVGTEEGISLSDVEQVRALINDAQPILMRRLSGQEVGS